MKKILLLGWKDLTLAFRDRAALIMMLLGLKDPDTGKEAALC